MLCTGIVEVVLLKRTVVENAFGVKGVLVAVQAREVVHAKPARRKKRRLHSDTMISDLSALSLKAATSTAN
jgi:hypothetical protein